MNDFLEYEEMLRKAMVVFRTKVEKNRSFNIEELRLLLRQIKEYGDKTKDIRYLDCITYFEELGISV